MSVTLFTVCSTIDMAILAAEQAQAVPQLIFDKDSFDRKEYLKNAETCLSLI